MAISRKKKEELVGIYKERLENSPALVLTKYQGISVPQINSLRTALNDSDTIYMIVKNKLLRIALEQAGRELESDIFEGPNAVAFVGEDIGKGVTALKDWIKKEGAIEIIGAVLESQVLSASEAESLSDLPTREEVLAEVLAVLIASPAKLVRTLNEVPASLTRVVNAPFADLTRVISAHAQQLEGGS